MKFNFLKNKEKLKINTVKSNTNINEETREKFILKGWIESSRKMTCTKNGTRGFLFGSQTPSKMDFSAGRSMVEMLGVLAIIGVLSIAGISGYTIAMRRYRANEIASLMTKYAFVLYSNFQTRIMNDPDFSRLTQWRNNDRFKDMSAFYECDSDQNNSYNMLKCLGDYPNVDFSNEGLGSMPSGVQNIQPFKIGISKQGNTIVVLEVQFKNGNKELCYQLDQMLGDLYRSDDYDTCDSHSSSRLTNGIIVDTDHDESVGKTSYWAD